MSKDKRINGDVHITVGDNRTYWVIPNIEKAKQAKAITIEDSESESNHKDKKTVVVKKQAKRKGFTMKVATSTVLVTFADLPLHFAKYNLVTYYDNCVQRASVAGTLERAAVAKYRAQRRSVTSKDGAGGGTGRENESIIKQLAANEYDGLYV